MTEFGGRAMCPVDEYDDVELREEMVWHAVEEALRDAGCDLVASGAVLMRVWESRPWHLLTELNRPVCVQWVGACDSHLLLRATSDEHLDEGGTVDLTATLIPA